MNFEKYTIEDLLNNEQFINYCKGEPEADVAFWAQLALRDAEMAERIKTATALFHTFSVTLSPAEKAMELSKLQMSLREVEIPVTPIVQEEVKPSRYKWTWIAAAAVILIVSGIYVMLNRTDYSLTVPVYQSVNNNKLIRTGVAERKTIRLSDGSTVLMNGLTELEIDEHYDVNNRVLWLRGEAHFSVTKNVEKPFIVIAGTTATTALGTSFKINNYDHNPQTSVMLTTGLVNIGRVSGESIVNHERLSPGEQIVVAKDGAGFSKSTFDVLEVENWAARRLVFSRASFNEIKSLLKSVYAVEIDAVNAPKKTIAFTGEFNGETLKEVLDAIGFTNHFTYALNGNKVAIQFE